MEGLVFGASIPFGEVQSINLPKLPDQYFAALPSDIPGRNYLRLFGEEMPFLAHQCVRYLGEPIFLLAGPDLKVLESLAGDASVKYKEKKPVFPRQPCVYIV